MILRFMAVSQLALRDATSNLVSLVNVLDDIVAEGVPVFFADISLTLVLERSDNDETSPRARVDISLDDDRLFQYEVVVNFLDPHIPIARLLIKLNGLVATKPGRLLFKVLTPGGTQLGETWITVRLRPSAEAATLPPGSLPPAVSPVG